MAMLHSSCLIGLVLGWTWTELVCGCTNLLVPAGSTSDGSTIITYSTDNPGRFADVVRFPGGMHQQDELREIFDFDTGQRLGAIPESQETYNVVSNTNEHQLSIGETTFGGLARLDGSSGKSQDFNPHTSVQAICNKDYGCLDYGSLIYVTLQRARTAREAISVADHLMQTYGYASSGESFSIADPHEVWLMEIIGKGNISQGSVWVATRIPDGFVSAHANQARTRTFAWNDSDTVRYSTDVASFARSIGAYEGTDAEFSFSDVYDPLTFHGARYGEARVFSLFSKIAALEENIESYLDYARGYNLSNRMPLFVRVAHKLSVNDSIWLMRDHFEGTWFDTSQDVGAGAWHLPYRLGAPGLTWKYKGETYVNERNIGVEKAALNIIANQRANHQFGVLWFGVDDSTFSLHAPIYGATTRLPPAWDGGNCLGRATCREALGLPGTITKFSTQAMHWVGQLIANYAYSRYDIIAPVVFEKLAELEGKLFEELRQADEQIKMEDIRAAEVATNFSFNTAEQLHKTWLDFWGQLFVTYVDGYTMVHNDENKLGGCDKVSPTWDDSWKKRIVDETGGHYRVPADIVAQGPPGVIHKLNLIALGGGEKVAPEPQESSKLVV